MLENKKAPIAIITLSVLLWTMGLLAITEQLVLFKPPSTISQFVTTVTQNVWRSFQVTSSFGIKRS